MIIQSGSMHGFNDAEKRKTLYSQMLDFFDRHIGQQAQGVASAEWRRMLHMAVASRGRAVSS